MFFELLFNGRFSFLPTDTRRKLIHAYVEPIACSCFLGKIAYGWRYVSRSEIAIERSCCCRTIERAILTGGIWRAYLLELGMSRIVSNLLKLVRLDIFIDDFRLYPLPARLFVHFSSVWLTQYNAY